MPIELSNVNCVWPLDPRQLRRGHEDVQICRGLEPVEGEGAAGEHSPLPVREAKLSQRGKFVLQHILLPTKVQVDSLSGVELREAIDKSMIDSK